MHRRTAHTVCTTLGPAYNEQFLEHLIPRCKQDPVYKGWERESEFVELTLVMGYHVETRPYGPWEQLTGLRELMRQVEEFT